MTYKNPALTITLKPVANGYYDPSYCMSCKGTVCDINLHHEV